MGLVDPSAIVTSVPATKHPPHVPQNNVPPHPLGWVPQPKSAHVRGVHPHTFATPPPAQLFGATQDPQSTIAPQPSGIEPQFLPCCAHVVGVHPHEFATPPAPQAWGAVQPGQWRTVPQPSLMSPQWPGHVSGTQAFAPQRFGPAPPQCGVADAGSHVPHAYVLPQPSGMVPQFAMLAAQFFG
jgi:hypothetical protein